MNFLAHLYLAGDKPESIIGNFIADHVKGNAIDTYSEGIQKGIRFHRSIDEFTDNNDIVHEAVIRLRPEFRKYAGVVLDMYYDHFLANAWSEFSNEKLIDFTHRMFEVVKSAHFLLPARSKYILPYMMTDNWLVNYKNFDGLHRALEGISRRTKFESNLENAVEFLKKDYEYYRLSFNQFFPQVIEFSKTIKE
jgi:acyl carrier protein phosphodiesterase